MSDRRNQIVAFTVVRNGKASEVERIMDENDRLREIAYEAKKLCNLICNSPNTTTIKGEIESAAFALGHYPDVLNAKEQHGSSAPRNTISKE